MSRNVQVKYKIVHLRSYLLYSGEDVRTKNRLYHKFRHGLHGLTLLFSYSSFLIREIRVIRA